MNWEGYEVEGQMDISEFLDDKGASMTENEIKEFVAEIRRKSEIFRKSGFETTGIIKAFDKSADIIEELLEIRTKEIDEFAERLKSESYNGYATLEDYCEDTIESVAVEDIVRIAEQMKAGGIDG